MEYNCVIVEQAQIFPKRIEICLFCFFKPAASKKAASILLPRTWDSIQGERRE
jgi:hypothetical protein